MVQRVGGNRRKTRKKFSIPKKEKGRIDIRRFMQTFNEGDKVGLKANPSVSSGIYHPRYHGKVGVVKGKKGWCYEVGLCLGKKEKLLIIHPSHLKRL